MFVQRSAQKISTCDVDDTDVTTRWLSVYLSGFQKEEWSQSCDNYFKHAIFIGQTSLFYLLTKNEETIRETTDFVKSILHLLFRVFRGFYKQFDTSILRCYLIRWLSPRPEPVSWQSVMARQFFKRFYETCKMSLTSSAFSKHVFTLWNADQVSNCIHFPLSTCRVFASKTSVHLTFILLSSRYIIIHSCSSLSTDSAYCYNIMHCWSFGLPRDCHSPLHPFANRILNTRDIGLMLSVPSVCN